MRHTHTQTKDKIGHTHTCFSFILKLIKVKLEFIIFPNILPQEIHWKDIKDKSKYIGDKYHYHAYIS